MDDPFADPDFVARYVDGPKRFVPGHDDMRRMAVQLLAEGVPERADILVIGAGGGLEIRAFADAQPGWRLTGVDPSTQMLDLARTVIAGAADRCALVEGTAETAPAGPFDGASCLLTLHLIPDDGSKLATLIAIRARLKPGAPLVVVDQCLDLASPDAARRLDRYIAFARSSGASEEDVAVACAWLRQSGRMVSRAREEALLHEAGFHDIDLFYAGLAWTGWAARA